jgi:hypothetical protein
VDEAGRELAPAAEADAALVQVGRDRLHAERDAGATPEAELEDLADHRRLGLVDREALLRLVAPAPCLLDPVAIGRGRAVPEALASVLLHRAQRVLRVLLRLVVVECQDNLPDHLPCRVVGCRLGDGDETDPEALQPLQVHTGFDRLAVEAGVGVHDDDLEGPRLRRRVLHHLLETRAAVFGAGHARLDILLRHDPALGSAVGGALGPLVRDGELPLRLPGGADPQVEHGALRHGVGPPHLSSRPEPRAVGPGAVRLRER